MPSSPSNKKLYNKVKEEAKKKFKSWPSAYASSWLVREYKKRGGKYKGKKPKDSGLTRWFKEEWIDVCKLPKKSPCGRPKVKDLKKWQKDYPYCRPSKKVTKDTPKTVKELTKKQLKSRCKKKKKSPKKKVRN